MSRPPAAKAPPRDRAALVEALGPGYQRLKEYLGGLPHGLNSYPECKARHGVVELVLAAAPSFQDEAPPLVTDLLDLHGAPWIPEVEFAAAILAMADRAKWTDVEVLEWHRSFNRHLFRGPIYRAVMAFFSPMLLLERGAIRWANFHLGTRLEVAAAGERAAVARLDFPQRLFNRLLLEVYAQAFGAALENARAGTVRVQLNEAGETSASYLAQW